MTEITRIGVLSLAKIFGGVYFVMGLVFWLIFGCFALINLTDSPLVGPGDGAFSLAFLCLMPFIYGVAGFVGGAIIGVIYNAVANWFGGIEVELAGGYTLQRGPVTSSRSTLDDSQRGEA